MYDVFYTFEVLHREKQRELARKTIFEHDHRKAENDKSALCSIPLVKQLPYCQCEK